MRGAVPPVHSPAAGWWETAALAGACAMLAFLAGQVEARLAGVLLSAAALLCAAEAVHSNHGTWAHVVAVPAVAALVAAAAAAGTIYLLTTA